MSHHHHQHHRTNQSTSVIRILLWPTVVLCLISMTTFISLLVTQLANQTKSNHPKATCVVVFLEISSHELLPLALTHRNLHCAVDSVSESSEKKVTGECNILEWWDYLRLDGIGVAIWYPTFTSQFKFACTWDNNTVWSSLLFIIWRRIQSFVFVLSICKGRTETNEKNWVPGKSFFGIELHRVCFCNFCMFLNRGGDCEGQIKCCDISIVFTVECSKFPSIII